MSILANLQSLFGGTKCAPGPINRCMGCGSERVRVLLCCESGAVAWCQNCGTAHYMHHAEPGYLALKPQRFEDMAAGKEPYDFYRAERS